MENKSTANKTEDEYSVRLLLLLLISIFLKPKTKQTFCTKFIDFSVVSYWYTDSKMLGQMQLHPNSSC